MITDIINNVVLLFTRVLNAVVGFTGEGFDAIETLSSNVF